MRKIVVLVTVAAICVAVLSPPVSAVCPDPDKPLPWMAIIKDRPHGDGDPWVDVECMTSGFPYTMSVHRWCLTHVLWFVLCDRINIIIIDHGIVDEQKQEQDRQVSQGYSGAD